MSDAPLPATKAIIAQRAHPWSRRAPRAMLRGTWAGATAAGVWRARFWCTQLSRSSGRDRVNVPAVLLATFRGAAPIAAREPRSGASLRGDGGGRVSYRRSVRVPGSRRAPRALCWRAHERMTGLHTGARIATIPRDAPAHCSAFAKTRRVVAGDEGGRVRHETIMQSRFRPSSGRQCVAVSIVRSGCTRLQLERIEPFHTGALIATLHRATPARRGMFGASSPVTRRSHPNAKRRCNSIGSEGLSTRVPRT